MANFESHDIPLFCPSGPPCFLPFFVKPQLQQSWNHRDITENRKNAELAEIQFFAKDFLVPTYWVFFFLDFCVHCSLRVLSKGQSTSWLCIKVSHAKGIYWTYPRHSCRRRRLDYAFKLHLDSITKLSNKSHHKLCIQLICSASQKLDFEPTWGRSSRRNSSISLYSQGFPAQNNAHVVPRWQSNTWWCW